MASASLRTNVVRVLFIFAVLVFCTGFMKFIGVRYRPLSLVHHYSGLVLAVSSISHMILNRRPLLRAFRPPKDIGPD